MKSESVFLPAVVLEEVVNAGLAEQLGQVVHICRGRGVGSRVGGRGGVRVLWGVVHLTVGGVVVGGVASIVVAVGVVVGWRWVGVVVGWRRVVIVGGGGVIVSAVVARLSAVALGVVILVLSSVLLLCLLLLDPLCEGVARLWLLLVRWVLSHLLLVEHGSHVEVQLSQARVEVSSVHLSHLEHCLHEVRVELSALSVGGVVGGGVVGTVVVGVCVVVVVVPVSHVRSA